MTSDPTTPLVVARFKPVEGQPLRFTASASPEELLASLEAKLPVDLIYGLIPFPDGKGYSLRELGLVALTVNSDVLPERAAAPAPQAPTADRVTPGPAAPPLPSHEPVQLKLPLEIPAPSSGYSFSPNVEHAPKSQGELLKERGLEQAPPTASRRPKVTRKRGKPAKALGHAGEPSVTDADLPPDSALPTVRNLRGANSRSVVAFTQATQAEAEAASHFNPGGFKE